tara:strand:+ start:1888 stop:2337 length:450 start_codon:yes stop_codon:yes gene_type:complete
MAGIGDYKKNGKFTLKSGNSPDFKMMGSSKPSFFHKDESGDKKGDGAWDKYGGEIVQGIVDAVPTKKLSPYRDEDKAKKEESTARKRRAVEMYEKHKGKEGFQEYVDEVFGGPTTVEGKTTTTKLSAGTKGFEEAEKLVKRNPGIVKKD